MLFPIIKIKRDDHIHIVGANSHDNLFIEDNAIHYLNSQGMVGTKYPEESDMYFTGQEPCCSEWPYITVEMVTIEELIKIAEQNIVDQTEASLNLHNALRKYLETESSCAKKRLEDDVSDTTGMLF